MKTHKTYLLFGTTNPYQAQAGRNSGFFRGRTLATERATYYLTEEEATAQIIRWASEDTGEFPDDEGILCKGSFDEVTPGSLSYHHDGYSWELVPVDELDEAQAKEVIRAGAWLSEDELEGIYQRHEDLRPVTTDED